MTSLSLQYGRFHYSPFANTQTPTPSTFFNRFRWNWYQSSWFISIFHINHDNHQGCSPLNIQYLIKVKLLFSALVFTIISYIIIYYQNLADEGVRCSYKGRIYYNNDQNNTLSKPGSILQNTRGCADNENNTIIERTGKVKIRDVVTRA